MTDFVFQHGAMMGGFVWDELIETLGAKTGGGARCLALDMPGCGAKRSRDVKGLSFDAIIADLLADIDASGMRDIVLVGHSQAGTILPRLAEARPGLFRQLVYVAALAPAPSLSVLDTAGIEGDGEGFTALAMSDALPGMLCNDMDEAQAKSLLDRLRDGDAWPAATYLEKGWRYDHLRDVPSTYVLCEQDLCVPPPMQEASIAHLNIDRVIRIPSGHQPMNSRPGELADLLLSLVRQDAVKESRP